MKIKNLSLLLLLFCAALASYGCDSTSILKFANGSNNIIQKFNKGEPCGKWLYYSIDKKLIKREKYRKGALHFTWLYNEKGRVTETFDNKGKRKKYKPCNCK